MDAVIPNMLMTAFSDGLWFNILLSVILLLVLSASMSTLSSIVLTSSSALSVDLLAVVNPKVTPQRQLKITRVLCLIFVALSFVFATFNFAIIVSIMSFSWGIVSGCFIGPFIWGLYSKRVTKAGAWSGMIGGFVTVLAMLFYGMATSPALSDGLYAAFKAASANSPLYGVCAMAVSVAIVPLVSLFTKKLPKEHVDFAFSKDEAAA